jgi:AcrR family transcriptional regulator
LFVDKFIDLRKSSVNAGGEALQIDPSGKQDYRWTVMRNPDSVPLKQVQATRADRQRAGLARRTQMQRRAESERRIIAAAIVAIGRKGSAQTSLAEIGKAAGYSRGLPAHLFGNKNNLIVSVAHSLMRFPQQHTLFATKPTGGIAEMLEILRQSFLIAMAEPEISRGFLVLWSEALAADVRTNAPELHAMLQTIDHAARLRLRKFLRNARASGELRKEVNIAAQPALIIGSLLGILWQWTISPARIDLLKLADGYIAELHFTLTGRKPAAK